MQPRRLVRECHAVHTPTLGDLVGARRRCANVGRGEVRGDERDHARDDVSPLLETSGDAARARLDAFAERSGQKVAMSEID